jgi:purine-nucleoside phosphorylase
MTTPGSGAPYSTPLEGELDRAEQFVRARISEPPRLGLVLGSGLGAVADPLAGPRIGYAEIPHMPSSAVAGHAGTLCFGRLGSMPVACLQGRVHLYEGHGVDQVVFGVRLLARLGCESVLLTNAAGGIHSALAPGALLLITDHLNLTGHNPLLGSGAGGQERFVDMSRAYDPELNRLAERAAARAGVELSSGVYAGLLGPSYETPAEVRMLRVLGADAVGMSTVNEAIALRQLGVRTAALSCITNVAAGLGAEALDHADVQAVAARSRSSLAALLLAWVEEIARSSGLEQGR